MGFVKILWKKNIQEAYLPKTNILGQIVSEILAQLCSDDSRSHHFCDVITLELYWPLFLTCLAKIKQQMSGKCMKNQWRHTKRTEN